MATNIGKLSVLLTANASQFNRTMTGAVGPVNRFKGAVVKMGKVAATAFAGMAVAAVAATTMIVKSQFRVIDALAKTSSKLGVATEQLAGFHLAARRAGVASKTFDMALQRMTRRVSEAAIGTGEAKDAIKELGLDAGALKAAGPSGALSMIADALMGVGSQADRVRLAFKLFDSEGVAMINMLQGGSAELAAMQRRAEELGLAVSELDVKKIERFNDAWGDIKDVFVGLGRTIAIELATPLKDAVDYLQRILDKIRDAKKAAPSDDRGGAWFTTTGRGGRPLKQFSLWSPTDATKAGLGYTTRRLDPTEDFQKKIDERQKQALGAGGGGDFALNLFNQVKKAMELAQKHFDEMWKKMKSRAEQLGKAMRTPLEAFKADVAEYRGLFAAGLITRETFKRALLQSFSSVPLPATAATATAAINPSAIREGSAEAFRYQLNLGKRQTETKAVDQRAEMIDELKGIDGRIRDLVREALADAKRNKI